MKKLILFSAMCAITMASCSKSELTDTIPSSENPDVINFTSNTSRAAINAIEQVGPAGFPVYAVTKDKTDAFFISGTTYKEVNKVWKWADVAADNAPKWPTVAGSYPMAFYAMYPAIATPGLTATHDGTTTINAAITIAATPADQIDYLSAKSTGIEAKPSGDKLPLMFSHITSKVNFGVIAGDGMNVDILQVGVANANDTETFNFVTGTWNTTPESGGTIAYDYLAVTGINKVITGEANLAPSPIHEAVEGAEVNNMFLLPQKLVAWTDANAAWETSTGDLTTLATGSYITMMYRYSTTSTEAKDVIGHALRETNLGDTAWDITANNAEYLLYKKATGTYKDALYVKVLFPLVADWVMGKGYTYNIKLGTLDATGGIYASKYFYDKDGKNTKIIANNGAGEPDPGKPVADGDINFTVTVNDWTGTTTPVQ